MNKYLSLALLILFCEGANAQTLFISPSFSVPRQFKEEAHVYVGVSDADRYRETYTAFWLNCMFVKAKNMDLFCPWTASGMQAAGDGASDAMQNVQNQIKGLKKKYSYCAIQKYLRDYVADVSVIQSFSRTKFKGEFDDPEIKLDGYKPDDFCNKGGVLSQPTPALRRANSKEPVP